MRRQPILIVAGAFAALGLIVAGLMALGLGRPAAVPTSAALAPAAAATPAVTPNVNYRQTMREHTARLLAIKALPAESATSEAIEQVVQRALSQAANPQLLPRAGVEPLTGALTERLAAMLEGPDAMLRLVEEQVASGIRSWQPPDDLNWVEASMMLQYNDLERADPARPLETYKRLGELMSNQLNFRYTALASGAGGSHIGFRVVKVAQLLNPDESLNATTVLDETAPKHDPNAWTYWIWGGGHSINLTTPSRSPFKARLGSPRLLVAECGFVLHNTLGQPITWNSIWYWDETSRRWEMHMSSAYGSGSALMLN